MPQTTTSDDGECRFLPRWVWMAFGILVPVAYLVGLSFPLVGPDEPRYAQVAREMMERGDWITPTLGGHPWFEKPSLLYWLEIVSYKVFGVNESAARFGPALFGLGTIIALVMIGRTLGKEHSCGIGGLFGIIAASTLGLLVFAHGASFDIIVTFPIAAALACFWKYDDLERGGSSKVGWLAGFYVFVGVALLAKGLIGIVFPFAIVGLYLVASRRLPSRTITISLFWGTLLAASIAAVWYLPMYLTHGWKFIDEFIIQHHFARFASNKYQHPQPFYFFVWILPLMTLPWLPFALTGTWKGLKAILRPPKDSSSHLLVFSLCWVAVPLVFFSISGSKLPGYILPAVPGAVIGAAIAAHSLASRSSCWKHAIVGLCAAILIGGPIAATMLAPRYAADESVKPLIDAATASGHDRESVLMLYTVSHNAEFYAAGRLERTANGEIVRHDGALEIVNYLRENEGPVLVLVPNEYLELLTREEQLTTAPLGRNAELSIVEASLR